jgi:hypothetical protein
MMRILCFAPLILAAFLHPAQLCADDQVKSAWIRKLPGGVTVELLGVCDPQAKLPRWWEPDGKPLAKPVIDTVGIDLGDFRRRHRIFAVTIQGDLNPTVNWDHGGGSGMSGSSLKNGEQLRGAVYALVEVPTNKRRKTVSLKVAATPWVTVATYRPGGPYDIPSDGRSVSFSRPRATEKGFAMVVVEDFVGRDTGVRAFDQAGKGVGATGGKDTQKAFTAHDNEFFGVKPEEIGRVELQVRPLEAVEFKDVALDPAEQ